MSAGRFFRIAAVAVFSILANSIPSYPQSVTKIVDHGPDGEKLTFVVLGDGYAATDQTKYDQDVQKLLIAGVFGHDFYKDNFAAFNVYRINSVSKESGVSTLMDDRDTALKIIYTGDWNRCWLEESPETDQLIINATAGVKKIDFVMVVANEGGYGGCQRGGRLYVTAGDTWDVVAHEYGHGIGGLFDEYSVTSAGAYAGPSVDTKNCSTVLDIKGVSWRRLITAGTPLPTDSLPNADPNTTVGMFTGCDTKVSGIYRPVRDCRMNSNTPPFCPVCLRLMHNAVAPHLPAPTTNGHAAPPGNNAVTYVSLVIRISKNKPLEIVRASQLSGRVVMSSNVIPSYLFAFTNRARPTSAQYLPDDPFTVRGFVDPKHRQRGEKLSQSNTATLNLTIPNMTMSTATDGLGLQFYAVNPAYARAFSQAKGDLAVILPRLRDQKIITLKNDVPTSVLGQAVKAVQ